MEDYENCENCHNCQNLEDSGLGCLTFDLDPIFSWFLNLPGEQAGPNTKMLRALNAEC
jgi:hypothetical protein